jgi:hypothetical protein
MFKKMEGGETYDKIANFTGNPYEQTNISELEARSTENLIWKISKLKCRDLKIKKWKITKDL